MKAEGTVIALKMTDTTEFLIFEITTATAGIKR